MSAEELAAADDYEVADYTRVPIDLARARVGHVLDEPQVHQHDRDHGRLQREPDAPRQRGGQEAAEQRPDGGGDRRRRADESVDALLVGPLEVAVDQGLHRRQEQ